MARQASVSKMVVDRRRAADLLVAGLEVHGPQAVAAFEALVPAGEEVPDLGGVQNLLRLRLEGLRQELEVADEAVVAELERDRELREERDEASALLSHRISRLRVVVEGVLGDGACRTLWGVYGPMPRDPRARRTIGRRVLRHLREGGVPLPEADLPGVAFDFEAWIPFIQEPLQRLEAALHSLDREERRTIDARLAKTQAMERYDQAYRSTARLVEEILTYVGRGELARGLRPKRPSRSQEDSASTEDAAEAMAASAASSQASEAENPQLHPDLAEAPRTERAAPLRRPWHLREAPGLADEDRDDDRRRSLVAVS